MNIYKIFIIFSLLSFSRSPLQDREERKIYFFLGDVGPKTTKITGLTKLKDVIIIGGRSVDPNNDGILNEEALTKEIQSLIPSRRQSGIAILDWEGQAMINLSKLPVASRQFEKTVDEYVKAIRIAKLMRPKMSWGVYGLPIRRYWNRDKNWENRCFAMLRIFKECDLITPSVYDLYPDYITKGRDQDYISDNVNLSLKIASFVKKPVYPFVTHRWPNLELIPEYEFKDHINTLFKTELSGKRISGVIWWGPDKYYYNIHNKVIKEEVGQGNFETYFDNIVAKYLVLISSYQE